MQQIMVKPIFIESSYDFLFYHGKSCVVCFYYSCKLISEHAHICADYYSEARLCNPLHKTTPSQWITFELGGLLNAL